MKKRPDRLQGTDGVRAKVVSDDDPAVKNLSPVAAFIERGLITPSFVSLYCHAFVEYLRSSNSIGDNGKVVIGYDPRDPERKIVDAAIHGVSQAGVTVVDAGIIPTPALGMYTVTSGASGGIMITASHNPADENGIKLFLPGTGLKLYPTDDKRLTEIVYKLEESGSNTHRPAGSVVNEREFVHEMFASFFQDSFNSWVEEEKDFNDIALVIDTANGSLAPHALDILERLNFRMIEHVGAKLDGSVNHNCGAGLFEGHQMIDPEMQDGSHDFRSVDLVQSLFHHGRQNREEVLGGNLRVCGATFDADADRFYFMEYDPFEDCLLILSGDEIAFHQASYLREKAGDNFSGIGTFATTVESDIAVSVAAEKLGLIPNLTAVGDKWILWAANCDLLANHWEVLESQSQNLQMLSDLEEVQETFADSEEIDAASIKAHIKAVEDVTKVEKINLLENLLKPGGLTFFVGSEESGHCVTASKLKCIDGREQIAYFGNGLKSAINLFAATQELKDKFEGQEFYAALHHPFEPGVKKSFPVLYTDKSKLSRGSETWQALEQEFLKSAKELFSDTYNIQIINRDDEPDMLYVAISDHGTKTNPEGTTRAALFVRNSGTEAKTSVYLRSEPSLAPQLEGIARHALLTVNAMMKDMQDNSAQAEFRVLQHLATNGPSPFTDLAPMLAGVSPEKLLVKMSLKQGLIEPIDTRLALTPHGKAVYDVLSNR